MTTCFGRGRIREDGSKLHPSEDAGREQSAWDVSKLVAPHQSEQAFRPLSEGGCLLERFHGEWNRVFRNGVDV